MAPRRVGVIFGGRSGEHEVSLQSAAFVREALAVYERRGLLAADERSAAQV